MRLNDLRSLDFHQVADDQMGGIIHTNSQRIIAYATETKEIFRLTSILIFRLGIFSSYLSRGPRETTRPLVIGTSIVCVCLNNIIQPILSAFGK